MAQSAYLLGKHSPHRFFMFYQVSVVFYRTFVVFYETLVERHQTFAAFYETLIEQYLPAASSYDSGNCFLKTRQHKR
jgi:hypothetical protein